MAFVPPYPADTRAKGYRLELDYERIMQSDTWALASKRQQPFLLMLWFVAWQQTPCGTLPDDDELIAVRIGIDADEFRQNSSILMRGWVKSGDGRLYHPVVTELVIEMLERKGKEAKRKADYRARLRGLDVPAVSHGTTTGLTRDSTGSDDTGTSTGTKISKQPRSPSESESVDDGFANFWEQYPKKAAKPDALRAWRKLKPSGQLLADLMAGLAIQKVSDQWRKNGGEFIPHPATWLNKRRWEDEIQAAQSADTEDSLFAGAL